MVRPDAEKVLSEVLTCVAHMLHHEQIKKGTRALFNIMEAVKGYASGDLASLNDMILTNFEGQPQPYDMVLQGQLEECRIDLWEVELNADIESAVGFEPPFGDKYHKRMLAAADAVFGPAEDYEPVHDIVLAESEMKLVQKALSDWAASNKTTMTEEDKNTFCSLMESLA